MSVYVLIHDGDCPDVRGVYADRATAEADVESLDDTYGYDRQHSAACCCVATMPLLTHTVGLGPRYGPPRPVDRSGGYLIPESVARVMLEAR